MISNLSLYQILHIMASVLWFEGLMTHFRSLFGLVQMRWWWWRWFTSYWPYGSANGKNISSTLDWLGQGKSGQNGTSVLKSTGGFKQRAVSPCRTSSLVLWPHLLFHISVSVLHYCRWPLSTQRNSITKNFSLSFCKLGRPPRGISTGLQWDETGLFRPSFILPLHTSSF